MPEDSFHFNGWAGKGLKPDDDDSEPLFIVNENAVVHSFRQLAQKIVNETAFDNMGTARDAVQEAALRKAGLPDEEPNDPRDGFDAADFQPGDDFWL